LSPKKVAIRYMNRFDISLNLSILIVLFVTRED